MQPEYIADPDAKMPEDWDEDMDGEWEPPMVPNPDYKVCVCIAPSHTQSNMALQIIPLLLLYSD